MRPPSPGRVPDPIPIDDPVTGIGKEDEVRRLAVVPGDLVGHSLEISLGIDGDGEDLSVLLAALVEQGSQLAQLSGAVWSPVAPIKHQDNVLPPAEVRQRDGRTVLRPETEVRCRAADGDPLHVRRWKAGAVFGAERRPDLSRRHRGATGQERYHRAEELRDHWLLM